MKYNILVIDSHARGKKQILATLESPEAILVSLFFSRILKKIATVSWNLISKLLASCEFYFQKIC
jgi:hypothetical protein